MSTSTDGRPDGRGGEKRRTLIAVIQGLEAQGEAITPEALADVDADELLDEIVDAVTNARRELDLFTLDDGPLSPRFVEYAGRMVIASLKLLGKAGVEAEVETDLPGVNAPRVPAVHPEEPSDPRLWERPEAKN